MSKARIRKDLTFGKDQRGDECFFVEKEHIINDNKLDIYIMKFRYIHIIKNGKETAITGYAEGNTIQWD